LEGCKGPEGEVPEGHHGTCSHGPHQGRLIRRRGESKVDSPPSTRIAREGVEVGGGEEFVWTPTPPRSVWGGRSLSQTPTPPLVGLEVGARVGRPAS
jgi:hypothetical protein